MKAPFSRRISRPQAWVEADWPQSARMALLHLLYDLVARQYVGDWVDIDREVRRIAREAPGVYSRGSAANQARDSAEVILASLPWDKVFDFCERLHSHLGTSVWDNHSEQEIVSSEAVQTYIADELQRLFLEEHFAYSFTNGEVHRRGRSHTRELLAKAEPTLGDSRLNGARAHYAKARQYFEHPSKPDYENAVKEAVCAVEAAARGLFPGIKAKTLGDVIKEIEGSGQGQLPKPLASTLSGLYGYRNAGNGVSHGGANGGEVTPAIAEYVLAAAASQIILLHEIAAATEREVPF